MPVGTATAITAGTAALGALGGKGGSSTQATKPYLPENYATGYDRLLEDAMKLYERPSYVIPTEQYATQKPSDPFEAMFHSPEQATIQRQSNRNFLDSMIDVTPNANGQSSEDVETANAALRNEMLGRQFLTDLSGQKGYGNVRVDAYSPEDLAMFGSVTGGKNGLQGLQAANTSEDRVKFLEALNMGRIS